MRIELQHKLRKKILSFLFFPLLLAVIPGVCLSQSVLLPGELVVTRVHLSSPGYFDFAPLIGLEEGTVIHFTDNAYVSAAGSLSDAEGTITYTAPEAVPAGAIIAYRGAEENGFVGTGFETGGSGDNMIVYQVSGSDTTYLYGVGWGGGSPVWMYNGSAGADTHSDIPPGLSEAAHTIIRLGPGQNHWYGAGEGLKGTPGDIAERVSDAANWNSAPSASPDSVATPGTGETKIEGNDVPDVVINEINADPGGDADGNGITSSTDDEFVEFVNNGHAEVDMSGWTFSDDGSTVRHVFPPETVLPASGALVLFANEAIKPAGNFGGAIVQNANTSPTLGLNDRGDTPTLKDASGRIIARYSYGAEAGDGQSVTRNPDIAGSFVKHSAAAGSGGLPASPGTRTDGASYRPEHTLSVHGSEGWRIITAPVQNTSFGDLFGEFRMQGIAGSEDPTEEATIYYWDEPGGTLLKPSDMRDELMAARGYLVYFFKDDEYNVPGVQGGFPKKITPDQIQSSGPVSVAVSATDANGNNMIDQNEGYNLLGNPFGINISVTAVLDALEDINENISRNVWIWNHAAGGGNGAYTVLTDGDYLAPFQAFFMRYTTEMSGNVIFNKTDLQAGRATEFYSEPGERNFGFNIKLSDGGHFDIFQVAFDEDGVAGRDKWDANKLFSLNPNSINLFSREGSDRLSRNVLPYNLNTKLEIPLVFEASDDRQSFEFSWEGLDRLPEGWNVVLKDKALGREVDLENNSDYRFTRIGETEQGKKKMEESLINKTVSDPEREAPRFSLSVSPPADLISAENDQQESVKLKPNYPNPFNSFTSIPFYLPREAHIELSIWNIVGQKVATLIDEVRPQGEDEESWNAADMPSGIYIAQLEVEGQVYIRKMTLIK